eukprot:637538_1
MPKRGKRGNGWKQNKTRKTSSDNAICASKKSINKKCYEKSKKKQEKNQIKTIQTNKNQIKTIMWYTFDWMRQYDFGEFCRLLVFWLYSCGTYREKIESEKKRKDEYNQVITGNNMNRIKQATNAIPQVPSHLNISQKQIKSPIPVDFNHIDCSLWNSWCVIRNKTIKNTAGMKAMLVRAELLNKFKELIHKNLESLHDLKLKQTWKIRKCQSVFYEYCSNMLCHNTTNNTRQ